MEWIWDGDKNEINKQKHGLSFETARLVFEDPFAASRPDSHPSDDRWQTVGSVGSVILFIIHTWPEQNEQAGIERGRIISARKATSHERKAYEEGQF